MHGQTGAVAERVALGLTRTHPTLLMPVPRATPDEIAAAGHPRPEILACDLCAPDVCEKITSALKAIDAEVETVVNNAGYGLFGEAIDLDRAQQLAMVDLNVRVLTDLTLRFADSIVKNRGGILNVASIASFLPGPRMAVYYATKAYVLSYSEALAEELRGTGVTVTALCPGPTTSGFQDKASMHDSALVKGRRLPTSAEVAAYGVKAMRRGQRVAIHGCMNWLMAQSVRFTPRALVTRVVALMSRPV